MASLFRSCLKGHGNQYSRGMDSLTREVQLHCFINARREEYRQTKDLWIDNYFNPKRVTPVLPWRSVVRSLNHVWNFLRFGSFDTSSKDHWKSMKLTNWRVGRIFQSKESDIICKRISDIGLGLYSGVVLRVFVGTWRHELHLVNSCLVMAT